MLILILAFILALIDISISLHTHLPLLKLRSAPLLDLLPHHVDAAIIRGVQLDAAHLIGRAQVLPSQAVHLKADAFATALKQSN